MAEMGANGLNSWKCNEMTGMAGYGKELIEYESHNLLKITLNWQNGWK